MFKIIQILFLVFRLRGIACGDSLASANLYLNQGIDGILNRNGLSEDKNTNAYILGTHFKGDYSLTRYNNFYSYQNVLECLEKMDLTSEEERTTLEQRKNLIKEQGLNLPLSDDEIMALNCYTGNGIFTKLNPQLRKGEAKKYNCFLGYLFSGMKRLEKAPEGTTVYSGWDREAAFCSHLVDELNNPTVNVGDILVSNGITSSSTRLDLALSYALYDGNVNLLGVLVKITSPLSARWIEPVHRMVGSEEYVFPPQATFKVTKVGYMYCPSFGGTFCSETADETYNTKYGPVITVVEETENEYFSWIEGKDPDVEYVCPEVNEKPKCVHIGTCYNDGTVVGCGESCRNELDKVVDCSANKCYDAHDKEIECPKKETPKDANTYTEPLKFAVFVMLLIIFIF